MSGQSAEKAQWQGVGPTVTFEVWRSGPGKGPDVRIFSDRTTPEAVQDALDICLADKADGYPDAPVEFYVVRVTRTREVVTPPVEKCGACEWEGYPPNGCQHITPPASVPYEPCVLDADGRCTRWSHDHEAEVTTSPEQGGA